MTDFLAGQRLTADLLNDNTQRIVEYTAIIANTGTTTTTETVGITTASVNFEAGRAYRITLRGIGQSSVAADTMTLRVRKATVTGDIYIESFRIYIPANGTNVVHYDSQICTNSTASDVNDVLVGTFVRNSGTGNVLMAASATHVSYITVEDIGAATDFPNARAIT